MSLVDKIEAELPYLRRYARALTGSQNTGDKCVERLLSGLSRQLADTPDANPDRVAMFGALGEIASAEAETAEKPLDALADISRRALLLTTMEAFSDEQAARALSLDSDAFAAALAEAETQLASALSSRIMIIEDEPFITADLGRIVSSIGHTVVATAVTRSEAVPLALEHKPDLILADVRLADESSGIDAIDDIQSEIETLVVFITAYPERLLTGERKEPAYLIPKPFRASMVKAVVSQALLSSRLEAA